MYKKISNLNIVSLATIVLFGILFFLNISFVNAQENTAVPVVDSDTTDHKPMRPAIEARKTDATPQQIQDRKANARAVAQEKREGVKEDIQMRRVETQENRAERKEELRENAKKRITAYVNRIVKRLHAALERMTKLADRVEARIVKLEEKFVDRNIDLSTAKRLLEETRTEIASVKDTVSSITQTLDEVLDSEKPKESFVKVRELIKSVITDVKDVHKTLVSVIRELKAQVDTQSPDTNNATDSEENNE